MSIRVAINGYGRIGRAILRSVYEYNRHADIQIVAINDLASVQTQAHLTQYDSTHGQFQGVVTATPQGLEVNGDKIVVFQERSPEKLPWAELGIDVVLECTGVFTSVEKASLHLKAGAKKVLISAPSSDQIPTIVYGVNHDSLKKEDTIVSNASCTTNCLAPLLKVLQDHLEIESGLMTTVHAYTNDQVLIDVDHADLRRARSATQSIIPAKTGAATSIGRVLPALKGKLDGFALRVPVLNVSVVDLTLQLTEATTVDEIHHLFKVASSTDLKGILVLNEQPLVSIDFNHHKASCIVDLTQTQIIGRQVKLLAWYDNEWGFSNRMLDTALVLGDCV